MKSWTTKSGYTIFRIISGRSNVFLLTNGQNNILIDTSVSLTWGILEKRLLEKGLRALDCLVLTHAHFDHASNARLIKERFGAKVIVHSNEADYLAKGNNIFPHGTNLIAKFIMDVIGKRVFRYFRYTPCSCDLVVESEMDMQNFGFNAYLLHTPGHTSGSMSLVVDNEIAIVGDTMFGVFPGSAFPPFALNTTEIVQSWGKLLEKTRCNLFLPSHGSEIKRALVEKDFSKRVN